MLGDGTWQGTWQAMAGDGRRWREIEDMTGDGHGDMAGDDVDIADVKQKQWRDGSRRANVLGLALLTSV